MAKGTTATNAIHFVQRPGHKNSRRVKLIIGGVQVQLYCDTGSGLTIIPPEVYQECMGDIVPAKCHLRAWGSATRLDTKGMFHTTIVTPKGAKEDYLGLCSGRHSPRTPTGRHWCRGFGDHQIFSRWPPSYRRRAHCGSCPTLYKVWSKHPCQVTQGWSHCLYTEANQPRDPHWSETRSPKDCWRIHRPSLHWQNRKSPNYGSHTTVWIWIQAHSTTSPTSAISLPRKSGCSSTETKIRRHHWRCWSLREHRLCSKHCSLRKEDWRWNQNEHRCKTTQRWG